MDKKIYLKNIRVHDGQFSGEKGVVVKDYSGTETSGFFENKHLMDGELEVIVLQEKEGLALIKLPGIMLEPPGDKGYITVKKSDIEYRECSGEKI
jgi:hypothetical protein